MNSMVEQEYIKRAFEKTAGETAVRFILEQALEDRFELTPHPAEPSVCTTNSPAGLLALKRPMMAVSWKIPDELYENERAEKLMSGLFLLTTGIVSTVKAIEENCYSDKGWSFHIDSPSTRYHLTLEGDALCWVSGTQGNKELRHRAESLAGPPSEYLQRFERGAIIRFNGGLNTDLLHSGPSMKVGERRRYAIVALG